MPPWSVLVVTGVPLVYWGAQATWRRLVLNRIARRGMPQVATVLAIDCEEGLTHLTYSYLADRRQVKRRAVSFDADTRTPFVGGRIVVLIDPDRPTESRLFDELDQAA